MFTVKTVTGFEMILVDAGKDAEGNQLWRQVKVLGQPGRAWIGEGELMLDPLVPPPLDLNYATLAGIDLHRSRLGRWLIARRLGLRCLVCNRRAGYGGRCPNSDHNG